MPSALPIPINAIPTVAAVVHELPVAMDTIEQTMPWLMNRYGNRLRGISFDEIADIQSQDPSKMNLDPENKKDGSSDL